jgi:hypothetical protein
VNLSFQNPAALAALPAAAIPYLLHRWSLSRAKPLPFPSLELLREALRSSFFSAVLSHRILLLLRTLLALALVLWLSRPVLRSGEKTGEGPSTFVLLMDVSASMDARNAGRSALAWAVEEAAAFLPASGAADRAALAAFSDRVEKTVPLTGDAARLKEALASLETTFRPTRTETGLAAARTLLADAGPGEKTILLFTDAARNAWSFREPPPDLPAGTRLVIVRPPAGGENGGIAALRLAAAPGETGTLESFSMGAADSAGRGWRLSWEGRTAAQGRLKPGPAASVPVPFLSAREFDRGEAALDPDMLPWDDVFHVLPPVGTGVGVFVVNGAPALSAAADETYFLSSVLDALGKTGLRARTVTPAALESEKLDEWNVLMLLNTPALSARAEERVREFVEKGGGLWMTAGDRFTPAGLAPLLPARVTGRVVEGGTIFFSEGTARGPVGKRLSEEGGFDWKGIRADKFVETTPLEESKTILSDGASGKPLLVTGVHGRGRTALLTTTADRDWTDLPAHPVFPVLCRDLWTFLAGRETAASAALIVDQPWEGPVPAAAADLAVERPDGVLEGVTLAGRRFRYDRTDRPGFYTLRSRRDATPISRAAVNVDRGKGESDLTPVDADELRKLFPSTGVDWLEGPGSARARYEALARGRPLRPALAAAIAFFILLETLLLTFLKR